MLKLGISFDNIDSYVNEYMLFYKNISQEGNVDTIKQLSSSNIVEYNAKKRDIPHNHVFYRSITQQLPRLYTFMCLAKYMKQHQGKPIAPNNLSHSLHKEVRKNFNRSYLDFVVELRNIKIDLCDNSFTTYNQLTSPYSCWPVIFTPYNLPPEILLIYFWQQISSEVRDMWF